MSRQESGGRFFIHRRDFIFMSSVAAVGVATTGFASIDFNGEPRRFSLGYTEAVLTPSSTGSHSFVDAQQLRAGESGFSSDMARLTVHGFWSADTNVKPVSVGVAAYVQHGSDELPFLAWGHAQRSSIRAAAPRSTFRLPVRKDGNLVLGFESRRPLPLPHSGLMARFGGSQPTDTLHAAAGNETAPGRCILTAGHSPDAKLRRGTYVVAFRDRASDPLPSWRSLHLALGDAPLSARVAPLQQASMLGNSPASFDYLLLSIDHA
jgi:hypothetical protein